MFMKGVYILNIWDRDQSGYKKQVNERDGQLGGKRKQIK
jgi:hypothetical protein